MAGSIEACVAAWRAVPELHEQLGDGATRDELAASETALERSLPSDVRTLYGLTDGANLLGGNLCIYPLTSGEDGFTVVTASRRLRDWEWPIPDEVVVFGNNGGDELFGFWLPKDEPGVSVVLQIGEMFDDPRCLAIIGDDLPSFLRGWTAYYLLLRADDIDPTAALDAIGLPEELRELPQRGSEEEFISILGWANPGLPDPDPDPYRRGLTGDEIRILLRSA